MAAMMATTVSPRHVGGGAAPLSCPSLPLLDLSAVANGFYCFNAIGQTPTMAGRVRPWPCAR